VPLGKATTYILPIRSPQRVSDEFVEYLHWLRSAGGIAEVLVVDGSVPHVYDDLGARCGPAVRHIPVDRDLRALANGKVAGVLTGVRHASHDCLVLADEDVRYGARALAAVVAALEHADLVRPQNYFDPMPWHACLDTARTLINRVTGGDWPGTFGVRRQRLVRTGGYDGNVLFENLEMARTIRAAAGVELRPLHLFVRRLPPDVSHFWSQRVRQAYDEFARPARLIVWLAVLPGVGLLLTWYGPRALIAASATAIAMAELGRRVGQGSTVFPLRASLVAPLWVLERAICAWLAVGVRVTRGGVWYSGRRLSRAATPARTLRRRFRGRVGAVEQPRAAATVSRASSIVGRG
jgi:hypothetical protein